MKLLLLLCAALSFALTVQAGDWPMWRYDSGRGGSSPDALPKELHLQWTRQLPKPAPAWPVEQAKLQFDLQAEPVAMGERIFVPSSRHDSVTAFSTRSGEELWRFHADGPIRFAPVAHEGRVFFNSDDGFLYAVDAASGELIWKVNGGPNRRLILGNDRLISSWPARGGVVLHEGKLFFAASIWSFMGIFIHCVDPATGDVIWTNSGDGTNWTVQPHSAPSFAGVVPQGHLAAAGDNLIVPGGRSSPAIYDATTGELRVFEFDKRGGGHNVGAVGDLIFCAGHAYSMKNVSPIGGGAPAVFDQKTLIASDPASILARLSAVELQTKESVDKRGKKVVETIPNYQEDSRTKLEKPIQGSWRVRAGDRLYTGGSGTIAAYETGQPKPVWEAEIEGDPYTMLAADDRLFALTNDGLLHCFGAEKPAKVAAHDREVVEIEAKDDAWTAKAKQILKTTGVDSGYAMVLGLDSGRLVEELVAQSDLLVVAVDPDKAKVDALRRRMTEAGLYGERVSAIVGDPATEEFPPYFCRLIATETPITAQVALNAFNSIRPYGGTMVLDPPLVGLDLAHVEWENKDGLNILRRPGALPDTDDWTHQYANAAQTVVSRDAQVKAPFGVLWFGGPSHAGILPRHGHGPSPQVAGGRLFIEGPDLLRAVDVYTGQLLWEANLPDLGKYYDVTAHFAGAGEIGSNYVSMPDQVYAVYGDAILELDAKTGERSREFRLAAGTNFGHVSVSGDFLITTAAPVATGEVKAETKPESALPPGAQAVIPANADWSYLPGDDAPKNWTSPDFDAKTWKTGKAGFGYGDGDDATEIDMRGKFSQVRIRREFEIADPTVKLVLRISYDDGFIVYLNGEEVLRRGVAKDGDIDSHEAEGFENFDIEGAQLRAGTNFLAIEGHNTRNTSSDFTLSPMLVASGGPAPKPAAAEAPKSEIPTTRYSSGSRILAVFDRKSGEKLWEREARFNFRHNNIAVTDDHLFCVDSMTEPRAAALARRGFKLSGKPELLALDLKTGKELWKHDDHVFGTFLNYSAEHDILVQATSKYRDRAADEADGGMMALRGATGEVIWHDPSLSYSGPCLIWHDQILTNGAGGFGIELKTGKKTGWDYARQYGCNTAVGSEHILTFRSGAAGFYDLAGNSGTGNLGGFRSSCTNNLIAANGVLNAPDYTRTCTCAYQNQTSLALIHMPEAEFWTFGADPDKTRIGINFGAPGDRRSSDGTLFAEFPNLGSDPDKAKIEVSGKNLSYRRVHSSTVNGEQAWIGASAAIGVETIQIKRPAGVAPDAKCRVRLFFAELDSAKPGDRVFDVSIQGQQLLTKFDIRDQAESRTVLIKEFDGIATGEQVEIQFTGSGATISGIEIVFGS